MFSITLVLVIALPNFVVFAKTCEKELKQHHIVPDIIKSCGGELQVSYGETQVNCGNKVSIIETLTSPIVTFDATKQCKEYATLLFYDPDAPLVLLGPFRHWQVINIPISTLASGYTIDKKGFTDFSYFSPGSPTGDHRYTFFLFCQDNKLPEIPRNTISGFLGRFLFSFTEFQKSHYFGDPVACNFMILTLLGEKDV